MTNPALHKACAAAGGNCEDLARLLGITPSAISQVDKETKGAAAARPADRGPHGGPGQQGGAPSRRLPRSRARAGVEEWRRPRMLSTARAWPRWSAWCRRKRGGHPRRDRVGVPAADADAALPAVP